MSEKQSSQNTWICQKFHLFTYFGATNITSKQKSDMTKVAIKNVNITFFGGIYHIMDVFSKLGFEKLTESVLGKRGSSGKAFCYGSIFGSIFFSYLCGGECLEDINALIGQFKQRPDTLLPGADTVGRGLKELTEKDIITFYNERGASEKNFDIQNNDFGWSHLPFSFMAENMVFMMVTAMLKNLYLYLVRHISDKVKPLKKTSRLKAFILHFVSVPAKWVRTGKQNVLNLYTNKTYYTEVFIE